MSIVFSHNHECDAALSFDRPDCNWTTVAFRNAKNNQGVTFLMRVGIVVRPD